LPTVTFLGPEYVRNAPDSGTEFKRGVAQNKTQVWVDRHLRRLQPPHWSIEGSEALHVDALGDGLPDPSWRKAKIADWIVAKGGKVSGGYKTKTTLLSQVELILNPPAPEPVVVIPEPVAIVEEIIAPVIAPVAIESELTEE